MMISESPKSCPKVLNGWEILNESEPAKIIEKPDAGLRSLDHCSLSHVLSLRILI